MPRGRPLGSRNGVHKSTAKPQQQAITQLELIVANETLPIESRQKALEALEALKPAPASQLAPAPQHNPTIDWWTGQELGCDPFLPTNELCPQCQNKEAAYKASRDAEAAPAVPVTDEITAELDTLLAEFGVEPE